MPRGRPVKSAIRQNVVDILQHLKKGHGYNLYKIYTDLFDPVTMRVIYYHLKKGSALKEFKVHSIIKENGNFSWGSTVEKIYYELGENARPTYNYRVKEYFDRINDEVEPPQKSEELKPELSKASPELTEEKLETSPELSNTQDEIPEKSSHTEDNKLKILE